MIDAWASMRHYAAHLDPIWHALPAEVRGRFYAPRGKPWGESLDPHRDPERLVMVASYRDALTMGHSPLVYVEHGAGQSYDGDPRGVGNSSYSGGEGLGNVRLFLCPNHDVAARWMAKYPPVKNHYPQAVAVGCPYLDRWHPPRVRVPPDSRQTVAVTFHWECPVVPESRGAWRHYDRALPALVADPRWQVLGHAHPRLWGAIRRRWADLRVPHTPEWAEVLDGADLLVADNTSAAYEFASTGRPVLLLNAPWYRRHVEHGLRFWSHPPGLQIDQPGELVGGVAHALTDPPAAQDIRARAVRRAYAHTDGHAAERAAEAIMEVLSGA